MFLVRPRFWVFVGLALLVGSGLLFSIVSLKHRQSQDENRSPRERQDLATTSETMGYFGALLSGVGLLSLLLAFVLWVLARVVGLVS